MSEDMSFPFRILKVEGENQHTHTQPNKCFHFK